MKRSLEGGLGQEEGLEGVRMEGCTYGGVTGGRSGVRHFWRERSGGREVWTLDAGGLEGGRYGVWSGKGVCSKGGLEGIKIERGL
jgi:hypothetical protein